MEVIKNKKQTKMQRVATFAVASIISSLAGGLLLEPMDENEWMLAQVSDFRQESSDTTGHWHVNDNADLPHCDVDDSYGDWVKSEGWSVDMIKKYSNLKGYHGFTMDKDPDGKVWFKKCSG